MYYTASGIVYDTTGFAGFTVSSTLELGIVLQLGTFHLPPETGGDSGRGEVWATNDLVQSTCPSSIRTLVVGAA